MIFHDLRHVAQFAMLAQTCKLPHFKWKPVLQSKVRQLRTQWQKRATSLYTYAAWSARLCPLAALTYLQLHSLAERKSAMRSKPISSILAAVALAAHSRQMGWAGQPIISSCLQHAVASHTCLRADRDDRSIRQPSREWHKFCCVKKAYMLAIGEASELALHEVLPQGVMHDRFFPLPFLHIQGVRWHDICWFVSHPVCQ